jgi:hypothetical protein
VLQGNDVKFIVRCKKNLHGDQHFRLHGSRILISAAGGHPSCFRAQQLFIIALSLEEASVQLRPSDSYSFTLAKLPLTIDDTLPF